MKKLFFFVFTFSIFYQISFAQKQYFPPQNEWATKSPSDFGINAEKLKKAVDFAEAIEYSGAKDLRVAILKGFSHEPYHQILGKTKKRGGSRCDLKEWIHCGAMGKCQSSGYDF